MLILFFNVDYVILFLGDGDDGDLSCSIRADASSCCFFFGILATLKMSVPKPTTLIIPQRCYLRGVCWDFQPEPIAFSIVVQLRKISMRILQSKGALA